MKPRRPMMVALAAEEIRVSYDDGSLEVDADLAAEKSFHSVDIFLPAAGSRSGAELVVVDESFRSLASLWGPVREALGTTEEKRNAQTDFNFAEARAQIVFRSFMVALRRGDAWVDRNRLLYKDPRTGNERVFHLSPGVLSLEEADGVRVSVSDPKILAPISGTLNRLSSQKKGKLGPDKV